MKYPDQPTLTVAAPSAYSKHQAPADDPGEKFAERRIGVGIGAARDRNLARDLGVAERGERADDAGDDERDRQRRAGARRRSDAGQHEDPGADDGADAHRRERPRSERTLEPVRLVAAFGQNPRQRLYARKEHREMIPCLTPVPHPVREPSGPAAISQGQRQSVENSERRERGGRPQRATAGLGRRRLIRES